MALEVHIMYNLVDMNTFSLGLKMKKVYVELISNRIPKL